MELLTWTVYNHLLGMSSPFFGKAKYPTIAGATHGILSYPAACKTWLCPLCGPIRAHDLQARMKALLALRAQWWLMTLTIDPKVPKGCSLDMRKDQYTKWCWNRAQRSIGRAIGPFAYMWTVEFHTLRNLLTGELNNPFPHLHFLIDKGIEEKVLRPIWMRIGGGFEIDVTEAKTPEHSVGYMLKYLQKQTIYTAVHMAKGSRIWGRSRGLKTVDEIARATRGTSEWGYIPRYIFDTEESEERRLTSNAKYDILVKELQNNEQSHL